MTAPVAATIILPDDSGNAGKKLSTQTRVIGGSTVHEHFMVPNVGYTLASKFFFSSAQQSIVASAHDGTTTGFYWFQLPSSATVTAVIRSIVADANAASALATPTAPVVSFTKFTFTGTASGASSAALPWKTGATSAQMVVRTAVTGMTPSLVGPVGLFSIPSAETAVGAFAVAKIVLPKNPLAFIRGVDLEVGPGEGLAVWQSVAGTTSDTRKFTFSIEWDEVDLS